MIVLPSGTVTLVVTSFDRVLGGFFGSAVSMKSDRVRETSRRSRLPSLIWGVISSIRPASYGSYLRAVWTRLVWEPAAPEVMGIEEDVSTYVTSVVLILPGSLSLTRI